ncbi:GMC family oxidoreductase N-terminal domain-containing protein [Mucilaginibacter sp. McL0603]|uniref:GMC family oxidoreductase N-terminal domain-containing protein n=1 Tax=Mucilaginibacter sp. McL0603 TaxID=3415670 RepID=UPI003CE8D2D9
MPKLFNFRGYDAPDPLDKASGYRSYVILIAVNMVLTALLLYYIICPGDILYFNGFKLFGISFSYWYTIGLDLIINGLIYPLLINLLRKSSSLVIIYLLVFLPHFFLDLCIESHFRYSAPEKALWMYRDPSIISFIHPPVLKLFCIQSVYAILLGLIGLFLARVIAQVIYKNKIIANCPTKEQYTNLFPKKWSGENIQKPSRDAAFYILRILGFSYLAYLSILVLGLAGSLPWPDSIKSLIDLTYANPALAINTFFKITVMIMLTFIAAYNRSLRFYACGALLCGHVASTCYSLVFHFYQPLHATDSSFLLVSAITDGAMIIIFLWIMLKYKNEAKIYAPDEEYPIDFSIPMTLMQNLYKVLGILFILIPVGIIYLRVFKNGKYGLPAVFGNPDPMIGNTVTLYATLAIISFLLVKRNKLREAFFNTLIVPLTCGAAVALLWLIIGGITGGVFIQTRLNPPTKISVDWYFVIFSLFNLGIIVLLVAFRKMYYTVDYAINTLSPSAAVNIVAMTGAFFGGNNKQHTAVLKSIDQYVGGIRGRKRGLMNLPFGLFENLLNFLYGMHPPFSAMEREEQRYFLHKYFLTNELERKRMFVPALADFAYQIGLSLNSIVLFANYSYINVQSAIGYVPVEARDRLQGDIASGPPPFKAPANLPRDNKDPLNFKPLTTVPNQIVAPRVTTPVSEPSLPDEVDYLIVGSGAGGATAAYRLACNVKDPTQILVVEAGTRYQPLQDFQDSEISMMKKVYKEGGLQQTKQFTMNMLQGECVGGSTVINNAVCFEMPEKVRKAWQEDYDIDLSAIDEHYRQIAEELNIMELGNKGVNQVVSDKFKDAVKKLNSTLQPNQQLDTHYPLKVNHLNNNGDGNWNLGNKRMRKRSMLETYIPWSEARGVKVVANMTAVRFISENGKKADTVILRSDNGDVVRVRVRKAIIVAGGAVASSHFLMRSETGNENIGKALSCNFAFPVAFQFNEEIKAYDGDQITLGALDPQSRSAFETYFNPPASFALSSAPFFFDRRDSIMSNYSRLLNFGALLGSEANGVVQRKADLLNGQAFSWTLGQTDVANIKYALKTLVQLGKLAGSTRAIIPTKPGIDLKLDDQEIAEFNSSLDSFPLRITDLGLATAHPQGGNFMCGSKSKFKGQRVVNEKFQVDDFENVFVADASLFPTSITVNPQWTIMAMSSLAMENVVKIYEKS